MARSLVLGNGSMLICYDEWGQVRDFYFPHVGLENHVGEPIVHRIGVFVDGAMYWFMDGGFSITVSYKEGTFVGQVHAVHEALGLEFFFSDVVHNEHDIFVRTVVVQNNTDVQKDVKLFFNQQFDIGEGRRGDTAYFAPDVHALVHYKGRRIFLVSAQHEGTPFEAYSVGLLGIEGKEGTWRDAEDGVLSKNNIEHGSVDSVLGLELSLLPKSTQTASYWIAAGTTYGAVEAYHADICTRGSEHLEKTTADFWRVWADNDALKKEHIPKAFVELYTHSLFVLRAHADNKGAIIASGDSSILQIGRDTYAYCWPRDAGFATLALLQSKHTSVAKEFQNFCNDVLTEKGYLLHKYRSDRSLGSSWHPWIQNGVAQPPIQEDETAITLITLGAYYALTKDIEFIEQLYNPYIRRVAEFLASYRDKTTGLPLPSHDLWEERFGVFTYTASCTLSALEIAATFAGLLGKDTTSHEWSMAAEGIRKGIITYLLDEKEGIAKSVSFNNGTAVRDFTVDVSAVYGLFRFGVLPSHNAILARGFARVQETLSVHKDTLGIARYEGDRYFGTNDTGVGNPWIITTLWLAEYEIATAHTVEDLDRVWRYFEWVFARTNNAGLLAEQYNPRTWCPTSVTPLVWSHAEFVSVLLAWADKRAYLAQKG